MLSIYRKIQEILYNYKKELPEAGPEYPPQVQRAIMRIHKYLFDSKLTVGWMKQQCRINGKSFSSKFELCMGSKPKKYILFHRIQVAKLLLEGTEATVTSIALSVGFNSLASFCNTFRVKKGISPSEWRKKIKDFFKDKIKALN